MAFLYAFVPAYAQVSSVASQTQIEIEPIYPAPGTEFIARLHAYGSTLGTVTWLIDGKQVASGDRMIEVRLTAPQTLGTPMRIVARSTANGTPLSAEKVIVPGTVDLIFEAETIAPYFYEGRRVPSIGADAIATAIPHLYKQNGARVAPEELFYTWSINNTIVTEGKGQMRVTLSVPSLHDDYLTLKVVSADGGTSYETGLNIPRAEPLAVFYPWNPLRGLSHNAVQDSFLEASGETTIRVEPYFVSQNIFMNGQYAWSLDGVTVNNQSSDPQFLTLQGGQSGGMADVSFSIQNLKAFSQYAAGLFRIAFN